MRGEVIEDGTLILPFGTYSDGVLILNRSGIKVDEEGTLIIEDAMEYDWFLWETLLKMGKDSTANSRALAIEQAIDNFINGIVDDPAYQEDAMVDGVTTPIVASRQSTIECRIKAAPDTDIHIGDIVECLDENWIVVDLYTDKVGIINGSMWACNDILRFQNNSSFVHTRHCVIDDGTYSRRTSDPIVYAPANTYKLYLPIDTDTSKLYIDKRLAFGKIYAPDGSKVLETYKIIGIDLKSKNFGDGSHLMVLTMQRDVFNESTDSLDEGLCDIFVEPGNTPVPQITGSCLIVGRDAVRIGTTRKYSATFTDADGNIVNDVVPVWNVVAPIGVSASVADGTVTVTAPLRESLVGTDVVLSVTSEDGLFGTFEKRVQVIAVG